VSPERVLPEILGLSASSLEAWRRCPREFYDAYVLGLPESDAGRAPDYGNLVHAMLERIHRSGSCRDTAHVEEVLALHGIDAEGALTGLVARHAQRCPSPAEHEKHELEVARFFRRPPSMFMATGRLDAVWQYRGLLEVRDYKTGSVVTERVADDPRARLQAWLAAPIAHRLGLKLRVRYEHLAPEIVDDPESFEPDEDDLAAITEELCGVAAQIRAAATARAFPGVAEREVCCTCRYRSICPESAAPGVPTWPTPPDADPMDEPDVSDP
jgi:RecB family exonuclease